MESGFDDKAIGYFHSWTPKEGEFHQTGTERVPYIWTLEGKHYISPGDFIITGIKGEKYVCKPDVFEATYEPVEVE